MLPLLSKSEIILAKNCHTTTNRFTGGEAACLGPKALLRGGASEQPWRLLRLPNSSERTDADIALAAVRALEWDAGVPSDKVKATVSKGWVTLRGEVEWQYQKLDAEQVIRRLMGIKGVTNLVTVKPCLTHDERNVAIVRASYEAYVSKNRSALEPLIADDFHFTSPLDNRIDRGDVFHALLAEQ